MSDREYPLRIHVSSPRGRLPEGVSVVDVDLDSFFALLRKIGNDPGLLLLTLRALRQRSAYGGMRFLDLAWVLRTSERRVAKWFERLSAEGLVIYQLQSDLGIDVFTVEIVEDDTPSAPPRTDAVIPSVRHALPTHWFAQVLPRIGRVTFLAYLYLLGRETDDKGPALDLKHMARALRLWTERRAHHHILRLHRHGMVRRHPHRGLIVADPPPLTRTQHLHLRLRELGVVPRIAREVAVLTIVILVIALALYLWRS